MVGFIIDNSFIVYQNKVSRQIIGIPMGKNCAPDLANIYLHVFEYDYIQSLVLSGKLDVATMLSSIFRFQDDLIAFEDNKLCATLISSIYPSVMELQNTNLSPNKVNYLDMTISIYRGKYCYKSYDKRNDFGFEIINYPDIRGNIPKTPSYGVFISQMVRFCHINKSVHNFKRDVTTLVNKLCSQGFSKSRLLIKYKLFCMKNIQVWPKFGIDITKGMFYKIFQ